MSMKILTVDDSRTMRDMLRLALTTAGYLVVQGPEPTGVPVLEDEAVNEVEPHQRRHCRNDSDHGAKGVASLAGDGSREEREQQPRDDDFTQCTEQAGALSLDHRVQRSDPERRQTHYDHSKVPLTPRH